MNHVSERADADAAARVDIADDEADLVRARREHHADRRGCSSR